MIDIDWDLFTSDAHRTAQDTCFCVIGCAVDGPTRKRVCKQLDNARRIGDVAVISLLIARLSGPCCLPPTTAHPEPDDNPAT